MVAEGTRSTTTVRSRWAEKGRWNTHVVIYRHWDGYLDGHGRWLHDFLKGRHANGPGRLAAMLVAELQADGHNPDLLPGNGPCGQGYHYQVDVDMESNGLAVTVFDGPMTAFGAGDCVSEIFRGSIAEYGAFLDGVSSDAERA
jgi:hypothetical protein